MSFDDTDPLATGDKSPAVSFKDAPLGAVHYIDVTEPGKSIQQINFDTEQPDYWPDNADGSKGKPKMAAVYNGTDENGEPRSLWAPIPSDLQAKLAAAQTTFGKRIGTSGNVERISVQLVNRVPAKNPKYNKSVYNVKIETIGAAPKPVEPDPMGDPWASTPAAATPPFADEPPF